MVSVWDWYRRERPSLLGLLAVRFRIDFWLDGWGSISPLEIGPMHLSVEGLRPWDWSNPVLQNLREWPTPTVVSSLSRVLSLNTNQPTNQRSCFGVFQYKHSCQILKIYSIMSINRVFKVYALLPIQYIHIYAGYYLQVRLANVLISNIY